MLNEEQMKLFHENYRLPYFFVTVTTLLPNEAYVDSVYSVYIQAETSMRG